MQGKTDIWRRLMELADRFGSIPKLAEITGLGYTTLKGAIDTRRRITSETAAIIIRKTGCSGNWLLTGEGPMFPPKGGTHRQWRAVPPRSRLRICRIP